MKTILIVAATIAAHIAIQTQGYELPKQFVRGMEVRSYPVAQIQGFPLEGFIGLEWDCYKDEPAPRERCWAGMDVKSGDYITGP